MNNLHLKLSQQFEKPPQRNLTQRASLHLNSLSAREMPAGNSTVQHTNRGVSSTVAQRQSLKLKFSNNFVGGLNMKRSCDLTTN